MFYEEVFRELNKKRVRYVVVGGGAVVLHGVVRMTLDLDLFVDFSDKNLLKFAEALTRLDYMPKIPVKASDFADKDKREKWRKEKNMIASSFFHLNRHQDRIDVFVYEPIKFNKIYKERKIINAKGVRIPIVSIRHLELLKKKAGRPQDLADIEALKEIKILRRKSAQKEG
ncbi:MAG: hypothetical protein KKD11_05670 [Candidatus Omnitrophica bacterium]|nr:hypothetical protein [Candidatus Omnitrophota bacterium]